MIDPQPTTFHGKPIALLPDLTQSAEPFSGGLVGVDEMHIFGNIRVRVIPDYPEGVVAFVRNGVLVGQMINVGPTREYPDE